MGCGGKRGGFRLRRTGASRRPLWPARRHWPPGRAPGQSRVGNGGVSRGPTIHIVQVAAPLRQYEMRADPYSGLAAFVRCACGHGSGREADDALESVSPAFRPSLAGQVARPTDRPRLDRRGDSRHLWRRLAHGTLSGVHWLTEGVDSGCRLGRRRRIHLPGSGIPPQHDADPRPWPCKKAKFRENCGSPAI